ncbi:hypothetical protein M3Y96_00735800 [Aphelenchoides besseyi]|nr:hypothetical protein M3Y96_00735800 [Aphelenchoides besseyi]
MFKMTSLRTNQSPSMFTFFFVFLVFGLFSSTTPNVSALPASNSALVPETDLYLRFRKNTPNSRQHRSDEYIHPFIRFRKAFPGSFESYNPSATYFGDH